MTRALVMLWMLLGWAHPALANEYRFGLFVGNNEGLAGDPPLVFAEADAEKMRELFVTYGGMDGRDAVILRGATARAVESEFNRISQRITALVEDGHEAVFVFYYSGHADENTLHLGSTKLDYVNIRTKLERAGAQISVAMVDACQSGGLVRRKGGSRGPPMAFTATKVESMRGTAILTSSAVSELSQESSQIGGGFFTHYLHTALTGGADRNRDGEVSLLEAYDYVHVETAFRTRDAPQAQTPHGDFDLSGAGAVVLTRLEAASASLSFLGDLEGSYSVWDESRKRYVAEVQGNRPSKLAVRPGTYYVHRRMPGWVDEATYLVRRGETRSVLIDDFVAVTYESAASRGDLERLVRRSKIPDVAVRLLVGVRGFGQQQWAADYFTPHAVGGVEARWLARRRKRYGGVDIAAGGGPAQIGVEGLPVRTVQSSAAGAATIGICTGPALVRAGIGARAGVASLTRRFPDHSVATQSSTAMFAGTNGWVGIHHGRFTGDVQINLAAMFTRWDDNRGWPILGDYTLALGVRF